MNEIKAIGLWAAIPLCIGSAIFGSFFVWAVAATLLSALSGTDVPSPDADYTRMQSFIAAAAVPFALAWFAASVRVLVAIFDRLVDA